MHTLRNCYKLSHIGSQNNDKFEKYEEKYYFSPFSISPTPFIGGYLVVLTIFSFLSD